jgi:hypothetical protein
VLHLSDAQGHALQGAILHVGWIPRYLVADGVGDTACRGADALEWTVRPVVPAWIVPTPVTNAHGQVTLAELPQGPTAFIVHGRDGAGMGVGSFVADGQPKHLVAASGGDAAGRLEFVAR